LPHNSSYRQHRRDGSCAFEYFAEKPDGGPDWQHFEEATKGSLEPGKLADLVILSANPAKVDPETIDQIKVLETIKEGKIIYTAK
jgi:hypothetical protein